MARREAVAALRPPTPRQLARRERERRIQLGVVGGITAVILIVLGILGFGIYREAIARYQETIATVDNRTFTVGEYVEYLKYRDYLIDQQAATLMSLGGQSQLEQLQFQRQMLALQGIEDLTETEVINRAAEQAGITVTPDELEAAVRQRFLGEPKEGESNDDPARVDQYRQSFDRVVKESGLSADYIRQQIKNEAIREKLADQIGAQVPTVQEQVKLRAIVLADQETANVALARAQGGEDFGALASELSTDPAAKENGGDFGWLVRGVRDQPLEDAAFSLQAGEVVTEPVKSGSSWYVLKAEGREERAVAESDLPSLKSQAFQDYIDAKKQEFVVSRYVTSEKQLWAQERVNKARDQRLKQAS